MQGLPLRRLRRILVGYLVAVAVLLHVFAIGGAVFVGLRYGFGAAGRKAVLVAEQKVPHRARPVRRLVAMLGIEVPGRSAEDGIQFPPLSDWPGRGASPDAPSAIEPQDEAASRLVEVATVDDLQRALAAARPGDRITLLPGRYGIGGRNVALHANGLPSSPIVVRARRLGDVVIELDTLEGFLVLGQHWIFENLEIRGVCASDDDCEHAFHIVGGGQGTRIHNCVLRDFNAAIKGNGTDVEGSRQFPDDALIEGNSIYNTTVRDTGNPVTPIDVVGANDWVVRGNLIADFAKGGGDRISYAAFIKGHSARGVFERNLVVCEMHVIDPGALRVGLSFGGGGSADASTCRDGTCIPEHEEGTLRNNVVLHCNDAGIYLNRSAGTTVLHNTLYDTVGIDVDFPESRAIVTNNLLTGAIRERRGGKSEQSHNLVVAPRRFAAWFANPDVADLRLEEGGRIVDRGDRRGQVPDDFCGTQRSDAPDIGAIEYSPGGGGDNDRDVQAPRCAIARRAPRARPGSS